MSKNYSRPKRSKIEIGDCKTKHITGKVYLDKKDSELKDEEETTITLYDYSRNEEFKEWKRNSQESAKGIEALKNLNEIPKKISQKTYKISKF